MSNTNKMLIDAAHPEETRVVVLRNGRVEEFDYESAARKLLRGNIYLAKVTRVEPALQAAFVDYGGNRHGFLAFSEIHPDYYQIPMADRLALIEEEAAIEAEEEAEADARAERMARRRGGGRRRPSRGRNGNGDNRDSDGDNGNGSPNGEDVARDLAPDLARDLANAEQPDIGFGSEPGRADESRAARHQATPSNDDATPSDDADGKNAADVTGQAGSDQAAAASDAVESSDQKSNQEPGTEADFDQATTAEADAPTAPLDTAEASEAGAPTEPTRSEAAADDVAPDASPADAAQAEELAEELAEDQGAGESAAEGQTEGQTAGNTAASDDPDEGTPPRTLAQAAAKDPMLTAEVDNPEDVTAHHVGLTSSLDEEQSNQADDTPSTGEFQVGTSDTGAVTATPIADSATETVKNGDNDEPAAPAATDADAETSTDGDIEARDRNDDDAEDDDQSENDSDDGDEDDDAGEDDDDSDGDGDGDNDTPEEVDTEEDAFEELAVRPRRSRRTYKIQEVIKRRQVLLIQVVKEERGNKGAALTTYLSLAGRYTVLMPNTARGGGISRKITNPADRKRLKAIANELEVPEGMGLIIRTAGAARTKQEIRRDFEYLLRLWESVRELTLESTAPSLVYEEGNLIKRSIRDLYNKDVEEVVVAGEPAYREAKDFMRMLMPSHAKNVVAYKDPEPLFTRYGIEGQLNAMFSPQVTLKSGGYLVINQTEALVAVDVNSGRSTREFSIEETALHTNLEAADELARQLKLRDLAGLIVIDFIDMEEKRNNRAVERRLKEALRHDRARIQVGRISHFGLLEMSRQRMRTGVLEGSTTQCVHCQGTGIIRSTESIALAVLRGLEDTVMGRGRGPLTATTTAAVGLYILNNKRDFIIDMEHRSGYPITIEASEKMVGANFAIERGPATGAPSRRPSDRGAVNMDWGFDDDETEAGTSRQDNDAPDATAETQDDSDGRKKRRRRRRRGGRQDEERIHETVRSDDDSSEPITRDDHDLSDDADADDDTAHLDDGDSGSGDDDGDERRRSRRGRRRGRRGGRRNRERQARREDGSDVDESADADRNDQDDGDQPSAHHQDASKADDQAETAGGTSPIPGTGPQPSISSSVIEITTPADRRPTPDAGTAVTINEDGSNLERGAGHSDGADGDGEDQPAPERKSRTRSRRGGARRRKSESSADNETAATDEPGTGTVARAPDMPDAPDAQDMDPASEPMTASHIEAAPTEPPAPSTTQPKVAADEAASNAAPQTASEGEGPASASKTPEPDRSSRTAPSTGVPKVERVTVGPNGAAGDVGPDGDAPDDTETDDKQPAKRGWWQRRILGE